MSSTSLWLLVVRQSVPSRLEAAQDDCGHSHTDSLRRIGEASLVPRKRSTCSSEGSVHQTSWHHHCRHPPNLHYPLFQLVQPEAWPSIMEKYLGLDPGSCTTFKPTIPGQIPPRRSRTVVAVEPSTPSNDQGPATNCRCIDCLGPPCLSPLSRPPFCNSCELRHGPTCTQCSLITTNDTTVITEPFTLLMT